MSYHSTTKVLGHVVYTVWQPGKVPKWSVLLSPIIQERLPYPLAKGYGRSFHRFWLVRCPRLFRLCWPLDSIIEVRPSIAKRLTDGFASGYNVGHEKKELVILRE